MSDDYWDKYRDKDGRIRPGVYLGGRKVMGGRLITNKEDGYVNLNPLKKSGGMHHEYIAVIPEHEKKLDKDVRKHVREIGPGGERGYVVSARVDRGIKHFIPGPQFFRGTMRGGVNVSDADVESFKTGSGMVSLKRLNNIKDVDRQGAEIARKSSVHAAPREYPSFFKNWASGGQNSNTYIRSTLDEAGIKTRYDRRAPGSDKRFAARLLRMIEFSKKKKERDNLSASARLQYLNAALDEWHFSTTTDFARNSKDETDPSKVNIFVQNQYKNIPEERLNEQEKAMGFVRKVGPASRGAVTGVTAGALVGALRGKSRWKHGLAGGAIGAPIQMAAARHAEMEGDRRRPLAAALTVSALPTAAMALSLKGKKKS